jgi:hypothetical protein
MPQSQVLRREVYVKVIKGVQSVRKLLVWKSNKETLDSDWPPYVVHWTDYSPTRKDPMKRTVRLAPNEEVAMSLASEMIAEEIKKGWNQV